MCGEKLNSAAAAGPYDDAEPSDQPYCIVAAVPGTCSVAGRGTSDHGAPNACADRSSTSGAGMSPPDTWRLRPNSRAAAAAAGAPS